MPMACLLLVQLTYVDLQELPFPSAAICEPMWFHKKLRFRLGVVIWSTVVSNRDNDLNDPKWPRFFKAIHKPSTSHPRLRQKSRRWGWLVDGLRKKSRRWGWLSHSGLCNMDSYALLNWLEPAGATAGDKPLFLNRATDGIWISADAHGMWNRCWVQLGKGPIELLQAKIVNMGRQAIGICVCAENSG